MAELRAFIDANYLLTVHAGPIAPLEVIWKRAAADAAVARRGPDFLYYLLADAIVYANFPCGCSERRGKLIGNPEGSAPIPWGVRCGCRRGKGAIGGALSPPDAGAYGLVRRRRERE